MRTARRGARSTVGGRFGRLPDDYGNHFFGINATRESVNKQLKAWEIKNTIDLALQPRRTYTETLTIPFPDGTNVAEIEATLTYRHRPNEQFVVHRVQRRVPFPR